jgi:hypothetical protein
MTRYLVTGRIHPERANVFFSPVSMGLDGGGTATVSCDSSQLTVALVHAAVDGWITAYLLAEDLTGIVIGSLGFALGSGYSAELIQVTEEDGTPHVFGVRPPNPNQPGQTLGFQPHDDVFNRALRLSGRDIFYRLAIRDFLQAINDAGDCATYCYRAVETIKSSFVHKTGRDRWDDMHAALGTDRAAITATIKDYADPVRHGNWVNAKPTDKFIRWKMLEMTRDILTRYLDVEEAVI